MPEKYTHCNHCHSDITYDTAKKLGNRCPVCVCGAWCNWSPAPPILNVATGLYRWPLAQCPKCHSIIRLPLIDNQCAVCACITIGRVPDPPRGAPVQHNPDDWDLKRILNRIDRNHTRRSRNQDRYFAGVPGPAERMTAHLTNHALIDRATRSESTIRRWTRRSNI